MKVALMGMSTSEDWTGGEAEIVKSLIMELKRRGIDYCRVDARIERGIIGKNLLDGLVLYRKYQKEIKHEKPDVALGFTDNDFSYMLACDRSKIPLIVTAHSHWLVCPKFNLFDYNKRTCSNSDFAKCRLCLAKTNDKYLFWNSMARYGKLGNFVKDRSVVAPSASVKQLLVERGGYCAENIMVIENGIDLDFWEYTPLEDSERRVLFYSNFCDEKGGKYFQGLVKHLANSKVKFVVTGNPQIEDSPNLTMTGRLTREGVKKAVQSAYMVVVPSIWEEPFGLVAAQAMAVGRPVVAFDAGGLREQVIDGETGVLVRRGDLQGLCDRVQSLVDDFHLAKKMGDEGRRVAIEKFDQRRMVERYVSELTRTIG